MQNVVLCCEICCTKGKSYRHLEENNITGGVATQEIWEELCEAAKRGVFIMQLRIRRICGMEILSSFIVMATQTWRNFTGGVDVTKEKKFQNSDGGLHFAFYGDS